MCIQPGTYDEIILLYPGFSVLANSVLIFTVHLVGLQKKSVMSKIRGLSVFAVWPLCILSLLYYLYRKTKNTPEGERRLEKKSGKKKR